MLTLRINMILFDSYPFQKEKKHTYIIDKTNKLLKILYSIY